MYAVARALGEGACAQNDLAFQPILSTSLPLLSGLRPQTWREEDILVHFGFSVAEAIERGDGTRSEQRLGTVVETRALILCLA